MKAILITVAILSTQGIALACLLANQYVTEGQGLHPSVAVLVSVTLAAAATYALIGLLQKEE